MLLLLLLNILYYCHGQVAPFTVQDLHAMTRVSGLAIAPNGQYAVYTVRTWTQATGSYDIHLELVHTNTTNTEKLTVANNLTQTSSSPVFSPDGTVVAFQGDDDKTIYQVTIATGVVSVLATLPVSVTSFKWSPTGDFIIFSAKVFIGCSDPQLTCTQQKLAQIASQGSNTGWVYNALYVRHWDQWETEGLMSHLFQLKVSKSGDKYVWTGTTPMDLMYKLSITSPVPPFGGSEMYDISPAGDEVAFTAQTIGHDTAWSAEYDVYRVPLSTFSPISLTNFTSARCQNPLYSPNGAYLGYAAMSRPGLESDRLHFNAYNRQTQQTGQDLAPSWDRSIEGWSWSSDSTGVFVDADDNGTHKLFFIDIFGAGPSGSVFPIILTGNNGGVQNVPGTNFVVLSRDFVTAPADIWQFTFDIKNRALSNLIQLTNYNRAILSQVYMGAAEWFNFNSEGNKVQGMIIKPYNFNASKKYPLAFLIHGGPEGAWLDNWSYRWNPQLWASQGYVTVAINPRGSTGYGQNFTDAVRGDWGGGPFRDLMTGADYIVQTYSYIDSNQQTALGASYGGFMINWINGHDHRFKCLVVHDGVFSSLGMYYSTEELFFEEAEFGPPPYLSPDNQQNYDKWSPSNFVGDWVTPTLVVHGGHDFRIAEAEGLSTFTALQRKGIDSRLLFFPLESHWVQNPPNGILWYNTVLGWLDAHTQGPIALES